MNRRDHLKTMLAGLVASIGFIAEANAEKTKQATPAKMPVLFVGHGSPMNAISDNPYTRHLQKLGKQLPTPHAIVVISAHWVRNDTRVMISAKPETIHDFGGFPQALFDMQYPAPGSPALAKQIQQLMTPVNVMGDAKWGLDHGAWTVLHHLYPKANIPVIQLSMNGNLTLAQHMQVGAALQSLRQQGVLILGSGNIVHNIPMAQDRMASKPFEWAAAFDELTKEGLLHRNLGQLLATDKRQAQLWQLSHPTIEHYLPLLYTLGASNSTDKVSFPYEGFQEGAFSMRSVLFS